MASPKPRLHARTRISTRESQLGLYLRDVAARAPLEREVELGLCRRLAEATRRYRLSVYGIPWVQKRVLGMWREARRNGRASSRMSDSFGVHAPEDRQRLERCLEELEAGAGRLTAAERADLLLDADLSHEILRRLHRELSWLRGLATGCPHSDLLERELGHSLREFESKMGAIDARHEEMSELRNELVESSLGLVLAQAAQFDHLGVPVEDLVQEGNAGLLRAAERFDWQRGVGFATYALWWIRHGVIRAVQNHSRTVRLPTHRYDDLRHFRGRQRKLEQELGRPPTREEIGSALGLDAAEVDELWRLQSTPLSVDARRPQDDSEGATSWVDVLDDPGASTAAEVVERSELLGRVLAEIATLPRRERRILLLRYGLGGETQTLREVGEEMSLSGERVRQLETTALERLRRRLMRTPA